MSVNLWLNLQSDSLDRVREALAQSLIGAVRDSSSRRPCTVDPLSAGLPPVAVFATTSTITPATTPPPQGLAWACSSAHPPTYDSVCVDLLRNACQTHLRQIATARPRSVEKECATAMLDDTDTKLDRVVMDQLLAAAITTPDVIDAVASNLLKGIIRHHMVSGEAGDTRGALPDTNSHSVN